MLDLCFTIALGVVCSVIIVALIFLDKGGNEND